VTWLWQILVSPHQVLIAPRRIREEIVVNRQPSKSAALPFPHRSHSSRGRAPEWQGTYLSNV